MESIIIIIFFITSDAKKQSSEWLINGIHNEKDREQTWDLNIEDKNASNKIIMI